MPKSDFICGICKKVKGSNWMGSPTEKYKCTKHGDICRSCVSVRGILTPTTRTCDKCDNEVLLYDYNSKRNRWEKA